MEDEEEASGSHGEGDDNEGDANEVEEQGEGDDYAGEGMQQKPVVIMRWDGC